MILVRRCVLAAVTSCAACATDVSNLVRVEPAPPPSTVTFALESRDLVYGLSVLTCSGRDMWTISNENSAERRVASPTASLRLAS